MTNSIEIRAVWKYPLAVEEVQQLDMPRGARALAVQIQGGEPCLWALVYPAAPTETRTVRVTGTGHTNIGIFADDYVGTFQLLGGGLVFHVFMPEAVPA